MTPSLTVTRDEAAAMLGVHYDTIRAMERRGDLHRVPGIVGRARISKASVEALLRPKPVPVDDSVVGGDFLKIRKRKLKQRVAAWPLAEREREGFGAAVRRCVWL